MSENEKKEMGFFDHLEELRWVFIRSLLAISLGGIIAFINKKIIFEIIVFGPKDPDFITNYLLCKWNISCLNQDIFDIKSIFMAGQFLAHFKISFIAGLIIASPYVIWEFWKFLKPALYPNEQKIAKGAVFYISFLFFIGILFGYFILAPLSINFLGSYQVSKEIQNEINLTSYISTVTSVILASGIVFELPVIIFFLSKINLVTPEFLKRYRRHAIIIILIIAAIITPPDILSQLLVSIPLIVLYEISISICRKVQESDKRKLAG